MTTRLKVALLATATSVCLLFAGPQDAQAQQAAKVAKVGVLTGAAGRTGHHDMFERTLEAQGWVIGRTITVEYRFAGGRVEAHAANAAQLVSLPVNVLAVTGRDPAVRQAKEQGAQALFVYSGGFTFVHAKQIADAALENRLPSIHLQSESVSAGGLMSYGASLTDIARRGALYVDKILKGAKPADLPVELPTRFEFAINMKTAKALGLTIPQSVLLRADWVID